MTNTSTIPLSLPWFDHNEAARLREALAGRTAGDGPFCRKVEGRLASLLGVERVLLTTSCTHALELALLALGIGRGHEVIVPSFTFVSTANAVLRVGALPIFADIEDQTLGLDPVDAERRVTPRTRALIAVHYAGIAAEVDALTDLARRQKLHLVEDAAQAFGATLAGRPLGTLGDAGCFSFHETKNITCGEGGALVVRDEETARRAEVIREKGTNRSAFLRGEVDRYTWVSEGSSYVLSDLLAAVLDAQLDKREEIVARRARVATRYRECLAEWARSHGVRIPPESALCSPNHHIFYLLFPDIAARNAALACCHERGIMATFHYPPLHSSPFGRTLRADADELPVAERVAATLVRLPIHPLLSDEDVGRVVEAVRASLG